jgi:hypothetical protein
MKMRGLVRVVPVFLFLLMLVIAAGCGKREPTLVLTTVPPDAVVAVEGFAHPGGSPHEIVFKEPGRYKLGISREGFRPVEMFVTLKSKQHLEQSVELVAEGIQIATDPIPPGPMPPIPIPRPPNPFPGQGTFELRVTSTPSGANVVAREPGSPDSRNLGRTPLVTTLPDGRPTEVVVSMPGYKEHKRLVFAPQSGGDVSLDVVLSRKKSPGPGSIDIPDPLVQINPPIDTGSYGFLSVNANPWCAVHVDGKAMGNTPLVRVKVKAGHHTVLLENRDMGHRRKRSVHVRPGEHIRIVESFD